MKPGAQANSAKWNTLKISWCPCWVQLFLRELLQEGTVHDFKRKSSSPKALCLKPNFFYLPFKLHWINKNNKTVIKWKIDGSSLRVTRRMAIGSIRITARFRAQSVLLALNSHAGICHPLTGMVLYETSHTTCSSTYPSNNCTMWLY